MFGETIILQEKVWNHPIETSIKDMVVWGTKCYIYIYTFAGSEKLIALNQKKGSPPIKRQISWMPKFI